MQSRFTRTVSLLLLLLGCSVRAEDIDLFVGTPSSAGDRPSVLFIIDNTGNWNTAFANEMAALASTFNNLPVDTFNVGLMMYGDPDVGYVRAAIRPMTGQNRATYAALISSFDQTGDRASARTLSRTISEAYRYLMGKRTVADNPFFNNTARDYAANLAGTMQSKAVYALPGNALSSSTTNVYTSPGGSGTCASTYIIYIGNNVPSGNVVPDNTTRNGYAGAELAAAGGSTTQIPLAYTSHQDNYADEWARFMKQQLGVKFYTVDVDPTPMPGGHHGGMGNSALLASIANVSGGKYFRVDSSVGGGAEIADALNTIFSEIQAVNSVFASVSLPLSVNTQGTYLNQVYVGMFRPDADALPRWIGNMKQYKLGYVNDELRLQDADSRHAINATSGFVSECARSFWTPQSPDSYWSFDPKGDCIPPAGSAGDLYKRSNSPDGNIVEKGAHAYKLRGGSSSRSVKTCSPVFSSCTSLTDFNTGNAAISQSLLNASNVTERDRLINWARGLDLGDENTNLATSEMRPSVHGDVVHSRPVALNLGSEVSPQVVVFYGGNDGVFRAINGNRDQSIGSIAPGGELWAFMPPEFYGHIKRLHDNEVQIDFPNVTIGNPLPKPYGIDGPISAYREANSAWIFATMRRGGRALYAFDVDVDDPTNITLKWKKGCPNNFASDGSVVDTGCSSGLSGIGQTWSQPKTLKAQGYGGAPLLIMGGGYDVCEDADPNTCGAGAKGTKIHVLDADTGAVLNSLTTDRSVIADISIVTDPATGWALFGYAVDLGGNVYRINIGTAAPASWTITKIASLGCDTTASCTRNRKFMFAPDVLLVNGTYILLLGSGDREKPKEYNNQVSNYFFMLKDRPADATWLSTESAACGSALICLSSLAPITTSATPSQTVLNAKKGWYLGLRANEQVVTSPITIFGSVTFSTHQPRQPEPGVCNSNLGTARVYNVLYSSASSTNGTLDRSQELPGAIGLPPSPVAGVITLDDGETVPFCIGCGPESPLEGSEPEPPPSSTPSQPKSRVYWYIQR